ncbi:hypothetical protein HZB97_03560 [Candidatus Gottesmanbacteria bacterium]|nr:hypothetical protein [Candidatus Gottesmanbacteria bacterium]
MQRQYEIPVKRLEKLSKEDQLDLAFDLINAVSLVRSPSETAALLQDLLTASEIKNLGKRLRIGKLLLAGKTHEEITSILHCSYATIAKVNLWLNQAGEGFRKIIAKLPKRRGLPKLPARPLRYHLPETIMSLASYALASQEKGRLEKFYEGIEDKKLMDKSFQEAVDETFRNKR